MSMPLPQALRRLTPDRVRHHSRLRALGLRAGLIPPRTMYSPAEAQLLGELAAERRRAVEIGVYEGSSALVLVEALPIDADLHLIDPFDSLGPWPGVMNPPDERATRTVVERAARRLGGPRVHWHVALSQQVGRGWTRPIDLVFIDGDHSEGACGLDWELWNGYVTPGGVVAFHDARQGLAGGGGDEGPTHVVNELFRAGGTPHWEILTERDTIVAVQRIGPLNRRGATREPAILGIAHSAASSTRRCSTPTASRTCPGKWQAAILKAEQNRPEQNRRKPRLV
jgi:MMP 1-O-methyltransferase